MEVSTANQSFEYNPVVNVDYNSGMFMNIPTASLENDSIFNYAFSLHSYSLSSELKSAIRKAQEERFEISSKLKIPILNFNFPNTEFKPDSEAIYQILSENSNLFASNVSSKDFDQFYNKSFDVSYKKLVFWRNILITQQKNEFLSNFINKIINVVLCKIQGKVINILLIRLYNLIRLLIISLLKGFIKAYNFKIVDLISKIIPPKLFYNYTSDDSDANRLKLNHISFSII